MTRARGVGLLQLWCGPAMSWGGGLFLCSRRATNATRIQRASGRSMDGRSESITGTAARGRRSESSSARPENVHDGCAHVLPATPRRDVVHPMR